MTLTVVESDQVTGQHHLQNQPQHRHVPNVLHQMCWRLQRLRPEWPVSQGGAGLAAGTCACLAAAAARRGKTCTGSNEVDKQNRTAEEQAWAIDLLMQAVLADAQQTQQLAGQAKPVGRLRKCRLMTC